MIITGSGTRMNGRSQPEVEPQASGGPPPPPAAEASSSAHTPPPQATRSKAQGLWRHLKKATVRGANEIKDKMTDLGWRWEGYFSRKMERRLRWGRRTGRRGWNSEEEDEVFRPPDIHPRIRLQSTLAFRPKNLENPSPQQEGHKVENAKAPEAEDDLENREEQQLSEEELQLAREEWFRNSIPLEVYLTILYANRYVPGYGIW